MSSASPAIPQSTERVGRVSDPSAAEIVAPRQPAFLIIGVAALIACVAFVFWHFLINQARWGIRAPSDWGHTLIIPGMAFYMAWLNRDQLAKIAFRTTWIALLPVILGVAFYMLCWIGPPAIRNHTLQGWGLGLTTFGLVLLFFGFHAMRWLLFPLAYMFIFGITIGDRVMSAITYRLQDIAAHGSYIFFQLLQFDVSRRGNTLELWSGGVPHDLNIAEACSGMRMLVAFLALGVFMAFTMLNRNWQRIVLVLSAVPVALFVNMLRVVTLGLLSLIDPDFATGDFHAFIGLVWLVPAFLIYLGIMWILKRIVRDDDAPRGSTRQTAAAVSSRRSAGESKSRESRAPSRPPFSFDGRAKLAVIIACAALVASGAGFRLAVAELNIYLNKKSVPLRRDLVKIPIRLGPWTMVGEDVVFSEAIIESLGTRDYLVRSYRRDDAILNLHIAYYTDQIDAVPHVPERCFVAQGRTVERRTHFPIEIDRPTLEDEGPPNVRYGIPYQIVVGIDLITRQKYEVRMPLGDLELRTFMFRDSERNDMYLVAGYFFIANGWATANAAAIRSLAFDRTDEYAYYCKVEFSTLVRGEEELEQFVDQVADFLDPLLPELMRCLPDWAEVERGLYPPGRTRAAADDEGATSTQ